MNIRMSLGKGRMGVKYLCGRVLYGKVSMVNPSWYKGLGRH